MPVNRAQGQALEFDEDQVQVVCHDNKVALQFAPTLSLDDLQESTGVDMSVMGVRDLTGNPMSGIISWHFKVS